MVAYVLGALGALVSVLTITQGIRGLTAGSRLRERIIKDLAIRDGIAHGPMRDELDRSISDALVRLLAIEAYKPRWWILPVVSVSVGVGVAHVVYSAIDGGARELRFAAPEGMLLIGAAVALLALESEFVTRKRAPLLARLRSQPPRSLGGSGSAPS